MSTTVNRQPQAAPRAVAPRVGVASPRPQPTAPGAHLGHDRFSHQLDLGKTWAKVPVARTLNFGHLPAANGALVKQGVLGLPVWADNGKLVTPDQLQAMGGAQRAAVLAKAAPQLRPTLQSWYAQGEATKARKQAPAGLSGCSAQGQTQRDRLVELARRASEGLRPDGRCYAHVWSFICASGYGKMPQQEVPWSHAAYAKQFAEYADQNLGKLGLRKLAISNPYDAPAGAIVVVRPGAPGTGDPTAGDIAVADGQGRFFNGGEMGYEGRHAFPPGNDYVLGVYVPA